MKIKSLILLSLLSPLPLIAQSYMAEGIDKDDFTNSTLFFDSGKGKFWSGTSTDPHTAAYDGVSKHLDGTKTMTDLLGDLAASMSSSDQSSKVNDYLHYTPLKRDGLSCWYQSAANVLEYWQHSYGVFGQKTAVSGYTYDKKYLEDFKGTQSLDITYLFNNKLDGRYTSSFGTAVEWYLNGEGGYFNADDVQYGVTAQDGGYFGKYFSDINTSAGVYFTTYKSESYMDTNSISTFKDRLASSLGYEKDENGTYIKTDKGSIASLLLDPNDYSTRHYVTCYGFEQTSDDNVVALYLADSDDEEYAMKKVYVEFDGDTFKLYEDEGCNVLWSTYGKSNWTVYQSFSIDTPDSLKQLEDSYNKADNEQVWSGGLSEWGGTDDTDDGGIATYQSGWVRYASNQVDSSLDGYFHSKTDDTRATVFNDYIEEGTPTVSERSIKLATDITTPSVLIDNTNIAYSFIGEGYYLAADTLTKSGSNSASFSNTNLAVREVTVNEGSLKLTSSDVTGGATVNGGTLELSDTTVEGKVSVLTSGELLVTGATNTINSGLTLAAGSDIKFSSTDAKVTITGELIIDKNFQSEGSIIGTIALKGNLTIKDVAQQTRLSYANLLSVDATSTEIATLNANLDLTEASTLTMNGGLSLGGDLLLSSTNKLTLDFESMPQLDENNYLVLFSDIQNLRIDGMIAGADTNYFDYMELSPEVQASLGADSTLNYDAGTGQFFIETKGVPEPSSSALALLGLAGLLTRRRRRG